jgi:CRISPR/Cas system CSM-associated protein Csm2 small subunit
MIFSWKKILKVLSKMAPFIADAAKRAGATKTV